MLHPVLFFFSAQCSIGHHKIFHSGLFEAEETPKVLFQSSEGQEWEHHPFFVKLPSWGTIGCCKLKSHLDIISGNIEDFSCCSTCCSHCSNLLICFYLYGSRHSWRYTSFSIRWLFDVRRYVTRWRNFVA